MAIVIIMGFCILGMWGGLVFSYGSNSVENGKYLLGITLPAAYRKDLEVVSILTEYKKRTRLLNGIGLFLGMLLLLPNAYFSVMIFGLILWFFFLLYLYQENVSWYAHRLYNLKKQKGWLTGNPHIIRVDTALSALRDKKAAAAYWFVPGWLTGLTGCLFLWQAGGGTGDRRLMLWIPVLEFLFLELLFFSIYLRIKNARPHVVCDNSAVNQKMDKVTRHVWSRCMVLLSYGLGIATLVSGVRKKFPAVFPVSDHAAPAIFLRLAIETGGLAALLWFTWHEEKTVKDRLLESLSGEEAELYGDDDEYWLNGYPAGIKKPGFTEKRIGVGWTSNESLKPGVTEKAVCIGSILAVAGICLFLAPFDFARVTMRLEDGKCRVEAASMGYSFLLEEVESMELLADRPAMTKKNGFDSNRLYLGDFRVKGYGTCKAYVFVKNDCVIRVDTPKKVIWFNGDSAEETERFYRELSEAVQTIR